LSGRIHELIRRCGFEKPTPIQAQALPVIMSGRDCIGVAKTGSGKTLAYVLPMLRHINAQDPIRPGDGPIAMIMGPTRELVTQIGKECKRFGKAMGFNTVSVYGGSGVAAQIGDLKRGAEIVACTPGRMIDLLTTGSGKITNLRRVTYMVLDEADRMFDMGFEPQITRILANLRPDRQTVMFSATFPHTMEALARAALENPVEIQIGGKSVVNSDIEQLVELRAEEDRFLRILELLGEWYERGKIIIFVASQDKADTMFKDLLKSGYPCLSLHGGKEQSDRQSTIADFKSDVCNVLVATSVAARGLDVKDLRLVINYDTPNHLEDYVHRVGRTGRAGQKGTAVTFISEDEEKFAPDLVKALKDSKQPVPKDVQAMADEFTRKRKEGLVGAAGSGFGGSGFKFNQAEQDALRKQKRDAARAAGLQVDDGESDSEEEPVFGSKEGEDEGPIYASIGPSGQAAAHAAAQAAAAAQQTTAPPTDATAQAASDSHLARDQRTGMTPAQIAQAAAQSMFAKLQSQGGVKPPMAGQSQQMLAARACCGQNQQFHRWTSEHLERYHNCCSKLRARPRRIRRSRPRLPLWLPALNAQHGKPNSATTASGSHFETELEINDFPQNARYKITHKDTIAQIMEHTGAAVTAKGQYSAPGRPLAPGDRKLYLLIEGPTERVVKEGEKLRQEYH
jgi:ATP-dependent RNA helicase DDX46/PRP5